MNACLNRSTDIIVCASEAIKREWQERNTENKLAVIYPPFDIARLPALKERAIKKNGDWVIGIVGRLSEEKRHIDLLTAFADVLKKYPSTTLMIVGDGYLRNDLERKADELGIRKKVTFAGFQENVYEYLGKMDLFVLPSRTEGSPLSILEAMAMGLPVIATNIGGIPEIVIDKVTGLLVSLKNTDELSGAIVNLLSNPAMMQQMGENGKKRVMTYFHPGKFIEQHENLYKTQLSAKGFSVNAYVS